MILFGFATGLRSCRPIERHRRAVVRDRTGPASRPSRGSRSACLLAETDSDTQAARRAPRSRRAPGRRRPDRGWLFSESTNAHRPPSILSAGMPAVPASCPLTYAIRDLFISRATVPRDSASSAATASSTCRRSHPSAPAKPARSHSARARGLASHGGSRGRSLARPLARCLATVQLACADPAPGEKRLLPRPQLRRPREGSGEGARPGIQAADPSRLFHEAADVRHRAVRRHRVGCSGSRSRWTGRRSSA